MARTATAKKEPYTRVTRWRVVSAELAHQLRALSCLQVPCQKTLICAWGLGSSMFV